MKRYIGRMGDIIMVPVWSLQGMRVVLQWSGSDLQLWLEREREREREMKTAKLWSPSCVGWADW